MRRRCLRSGFLFASLTALAAQDASKAVARPPAHLAEVDAKAVSELIVVFDREMRTDGLPICGGGPSFPKVTGRPRWQGRSTLIGEVELVPDHDYRMSLDCPGAQNFRSKDGAARQRVPWWFSALPKKLPDQKKQKRNQAAFKILMKTLEDRNSYYDLRVDDWKQLDRATWTDRPGRVGQPTFGSYGNPQKFELGNGVTIRVPS